jgi:hypothetical protein
MDYRALNSITIKNRAPLPLISDMLRDLSKAAVFTALDLISAYYQVRMADEDVHKTAFVTPFGQFESLVMLCALANAPADFQSFMNDVFKDMIGKFVLVYLDDIIIYSENPDEHDQHVREVLQRLREYELYCNLEKCQFRTTSLAYLGYTLSTDGLEMDLNKVKSILEWPIPTNKKDVRSFLGFTNFYRKFIGSYSSLCQPLNALLKKDASFAWGDDQQKAFEEIKHAFLDASFLYHPNESKKFVIETDASDFAISGGFSQYDDSGELRAICFYSRQLLQAERNYEVYDRELLAIVSCFKEWRHYLQAARHPVLVFCDHKNLVYFTTSKVLTKRQIHWSLFLEEFNFKITYRPGKVNVKPDLLSRGQDYDTEEIKSGKILLPKELFANGTPILVPSNDQPVYSDVLDTNIDLFQDWPLLIAHFFEDHEWLPVPEQYLRKCRSELTNFTVKANRLYRILGDKIRTTKYVPFAGRANLMKRFHVGLGHLKFD